jgi:ABC-2 type transport system ATP-binding protein
MINDPELLILDEPTSGLDPIGCREIKDLISLLKSRGKTVIVCSHLLSDVESVCDRVIIMYGGKIRAVGALSELLSVADINTFSVPSLTMEKTVEVLGLLRKYLHTHDIKVSHPKKSLEDYFLEVIEKAREDQVETSGASSGGKIAAYLQDEEDSSSDELLSGLAASEPENDTSIQNKSDEEKATDDQAADQSLNNLLSGEPEEDAQETADAAEEKEDLSQVNDKLKDLLK